MSMKPRLEDGAKAIPGTVNDPKKTSENQNIPGTVTTSKPEVCHPIPGGVSQGYGK